MNSESSDESIQHGKQTRRRAGSLWGDLNETKKVVEAMVEAERRTRHEKTLALRALRVARASSEKPREPKER